LHRRNKVNDINWALGPLNFRGCNQKSLRATLNEGARCKVQQNGPFLLVESHKLDPWPLDEDPKPIEAKLKWHLHGTILEGNSIGPNPKMELKGELMVCKTKM
jgi:hypothetical protein